MSERTAEQIADDFIALAANKGPEEAAQYLGMQDLEDGHKAMLLILAKLASG